MELYFPYFLPKYTDRHSRSHSYVTWAVLSARPHLYLKENLSNNSGDGLKGEKIKRPALSDLPFLRIKIAGGFQIVLKRRRMANYLIPC